MPYVDSAGIGSAVRAAMHHPEFDRHGGSRWSRTSDELFWVFEADRGASWARSGLMVGVAVRTWLDGGRPPRANDCHVYIEYVHLGDAVPVEASAGRFNDHRSYFTMVFDHTHDLISDAERTRAFQFMAADLLGWARRVREVSDLREAVESGVLDSAFVDPRLR